MAKKRQLGVILSLAFLLLYAPVATCNEVPGDVAAEAFCHVYVDVNPNIAVNAMYPTFDLGGIQVGEIHGIVPFRIDANTEQVRIWLAASRLYKGDQPDGTEVDPILFSWLTQGCEIYAESASPTGGADNHVDYITPMEIDGFPAFSTTALVFESAQNNHFSQGVDAVVHWYQNDPEKPMGQYSGRVKMLAEVVLPE
jgi:hypothetical protein